MSTRRQVLVAAAAAPLVAAVPVARAQGPQGDAGVLYRVAEVEVLLRYAYGLVSRSELPAAGAELQTVALEFAGHESEHLGALATTLEALGSERPSMPTTVEQLDAGAAALDVAPGYAARTGVRDRTEFLLALEAASAREMELAAGRLGDLNLIQTTLTILGSQAQHRAVLEMLLGRGPS